MWEVFWDWAWQRHHNVLSWYIRPLFLIPYVWFAHRRSVTGMLVTLAALGTSMFWFPAPARVEPWVEEFLAAELAYLNSPWTAAKVLGTLAVPAFLGLLAVAFWKRSWRWGVGVLVAGALGKLLWSVLEAGPSGWAIAAPALIGLAACVAAVLIGVRWRARRHPEGGRP
ncbi:hypothetical protein G7070_03740 [Propioniciclava coleopterorum]|uniref:Uncharacterized protein n=1 Tax=Propioniciclava coleopterorum TaxID=2714937 RepID=A0A6G7Y408_9ACTN|nr:hypothetical protein [Propioniciclava coleopterorum]QIK71545.1 hypothetical protein G7070_03740 [Propioniciclava coleopterorum]